jgi:hypothetical protein
MVAKEKHGSRGGGRASHIVEMFEYHVPHAHITVNIRAFDWPVQGAR